MTAMQTTDVDAQNPTSSPVGAVLLLLLMPTVAASVVLGVQLYLGEGVRYPTMMMVASLALFIYAANGLSDGAEDTVNDVVRAAALRRHALWTLALSATGIVVAALLLLGKGKLHVVYALVLLVGVAYSFRVIPHPLGGGRSPVRLKDIPLVKNVSIGATWAGAAFLGPVLDLDTPPDSAARIGLVGVGYALLIAVNSLFCDVRDERGDRAANVHTLPVRFGAERCFRGTLLVMATWTALLCAAFARGVLDARHLVFLACTALGYPVGVWLVVTKVRPSQAVSNGVIESCDIFFTLGLIALSW
jgi:4-hydroxybenzoate polyprenyltransferase